MNLIEKWKNRETKKKLREENIHLTEQNENLKKQLEASFGIMNRPNIIKEERNVHRMRAQFLVEKNNPYRTDFSAEYIKHEIAGNMLKELEEVIEYDFFDTEVGRIYTGTLWAATGDKRITE